MRERHQWRRWVWVLMMLPIGSSAQADGDGPKSVRWNCMDVAVTGLRWNSDTDTYRDANFFMQQHTIQQNGDQLLFPATLNFAEGVQCAFRPKIPVLSCDDGIRTFNLNVQTGYATHSKAYGWMDPYSKPDPMFVAAAICRR
ncbi:MAG: hypothetical protein HOD47_06460 [Gammaproteobacteria bacterium]|nr:hypothetical protein [Gammaproteobacteria bacterium]